MVSPAKDPYPVDILSVVALLEPVRQVQWWQKKVQLTQPRTSGVTPTPSHSGWRVPSVHPLGVSVSTNKRPCLNLRCLYGTRGWVTVGVAGHPGRTSSMSTDRTAGQGGRDRGEGKVSVGNQRHTAANQKCRIKVNPTSGRGRPSSPSTPTQRASHVLHQT